MRRKKNNQDSPRILNDYSYLPSSIELWLKNVPATAAVISVSRVAAISAPTAIVNQVILLMPTPSEKSGEAYFSNGVKF
mgnify:CR=1 FL=1